MADALSKSAGTWNLSGDPSGAGAVFHPRVQVRVFTRQHFGAGRVFSQPTLNPPRCHRLSPIVPVPVYSFPMHTRETNRKMTRVLHKQWRCPPDQRLTRTSVLYLLRSTMLLSPLFFHSSVPLPVCEVDASPSCFSLSDGKGTNIWMRIRTTRCYLVGSWFTTDRILYLGKQIHKSIWSMGQYKLLSLRQIIEQMKSGTAKCPASLHSRLFWQPLS
jgi:hypothetical protein